MFATRGFLFMVHSLVLFHASRVTLVFMNVYETLILDVFFRNTSHTSPEKVENSSSYDLSAPSEHDYMALPDTDTSLNLKETELRLGLPGTHHYPHGRVCLFGKYLDSNDKSNGFAVTTLKNLASAIDEPNEKWILPMIASASAGAIKVPVEGWPPVRSCRKNTMGSNLAKNGHDEDGCLYVKVSMDGAPYLRKVDLKTCRNYMELSSALEKMFGCFNISEYVVIYKDKDGDWMLVGDVPWQMFTDSCRRLRIMNGSEAVGSLAPRAMEKCRNQNSYHIHVSQIL